MRAAVAIFQIESVVLVPVGLDVLLFDIEPFEDQEVIVRCGQFQQQGSQRVLRRAVFTAAVLAHCTQCCPGSRRRLELPAFRRNSGKALTALQATLSHCYGADITIDGQFGPRTNPH